MPRRSAEAGANWTFVTVATAPPVPRPRTGSASRARFRPAAPPWLVDGGLLLGLVLLALALRLPNHQLIPAFTDEIDDISRGLRAARGEFFPLTDSSTYIGSLWDWLMAAAFRLSDFSLYAPRALILAIGVLTVVGVYPLGRAWGGRAGGLLTAALLTTAAEHIVINSHVAWSNCVTPLFTSLAVW